MNRHRHRHLWNGREITEFRIQYEGYIDGLWHPIIRYDNAHGYPHHDIIHPDGTQTKERYPNYTNAEVLTIGQRDIVENWRAYRDAYMKEMDS